MPAAEPALPPARRLQSCKSELTTHTVTAYKAHTRLRLINQSRPAPSGFEVRSLSYFTKKYAAWG